MRVITIITGLITIIFIFNILAFFTSKFHLKTDYWKCENGEWMQVGNPSIPKPDKECLLEKKFNSAKEASEENNDIVDKDWYAVTIEFSDNSTPLGFKFPLSWQDNCKEEIVEEESGTRRAKIYYLGEDENALLFMMNIYPKNMDINEIESMPNNSIFGQNVNYYYTFSQALDIPYTEDSNDYRPYLKMAGEIEEVIDNNIILSSDYETHDIKIDENYDEKNIVIDVSFPYLEGPLLENSFNDLIVDYVENIVFGFKEKMFTPESVENANKNQSVLKLNYNLESVDVDNHIITINIYGFEKINENQDDINKTFKYDLKNDKELEI